MNPIKASGNESNHIPFVSGSKPMTSPANKRSGKQEFTSTATDSLPLLSPSGFNSQLNQLAQSSSTPHLQFTELEPAFLAISNETMQVAVEEFRKASAQAMEKEFRFAPPESNANKLFRAMELLARLESNLNQSQDPEAHQILNMRKTQLQHLIQSLNESPEVKAAYARIRESALKASHIEQSHLTSHAGYLLSQTFLDRLLSKPAAEQSIVLKQELSKLQFFSPQFAASVSSELSAKLMLEDGLRQLRDLDIEQKDGVKQEVNYIINDLINTSNSTASAAFGPLRELHKVLTQLNPDQINRFKDVLVQVSLDIESMDSKQIVNAVKQIEGLPPDIKQELAKLDWHGNLRKVLSSVASIGTIVSLTRSAEDIKAQGANVQNSINLVKNTVSLIGSSKDIMQTNALLAHWTGFEQSAQKLNSFGASLEAMKAVKWAGPVASVIGVGNDLYEMNREIQNEDTAGAVLKGVSASASAVAAGAGAVAAWYGAGATATAIAGPVGLAAVAIGAGAAISYSMVSESQETGEFRKELRALGISAQEDALADDFAQAMQKNSQGMYRTGDASGWAANKTLDQQAQLITALMDQHTSENEEKWIFELIQDKISPQGTEPNQSSQNDFISLLARLDLRRLANELDAEPVKEILAQLNQQQHNPQSTEFIAQLALGLADRHHLEHLSDAQGKPLPAVYNLKPETLKEMLCALMKGHTNSRSETFALALLQDTPPEKLAAILKQADQAFFDQALSELPAGTGAALLQQFQQMAVSFKPSESNPRNTLQKTDLQVALGEPLQALIKSLADHSNTWFSEGQQKALNQALSPELTQYLQPDSLSYLARQLMNARVSLPQASSQALVKLLQQSSDAQLSRLLNDQTENFARQLASSVDQKQANQLLERLLKYQNPPEQAFQSLALGLSENGHETVVKDFLSHHPGLDLSKTPVLKLLNAPKDKAQLAKLAQNREQIIKLSPGEQAHVIRYLMQGWTQDKNETLIKDILVHSHQQSPEKFKALLDQIDAYQLANELGDFLIPGRGNAESLQVLELIAKSGSQPAFEAYTSRLGKDDQVDVLYRFVSKAQNQSQIAKLPAKVVKELSENLMKGATGDQAEKVITQFLLNASETAFLEVLSQQDFANWISQELQTDEAAWLKQLKGDADQLQVIMRRLGQIAKRMEEAQTAQNKGQALMPGQQVILTRLESLTAAQNAYAMAIAQRDYGRILLKTASSPETEASVRLLKPPVLKAMLTEIMRGYTGKESQQAISALLQKTSPEQLQALLDKANGGEALLADLAKELDNEQLRALLNKLISDNSVNSGMGFSYLAAKLAEQHHGETLKDLIAQRPGIVQQIHPMVLQDITIKLSQGWTSTDAQSAITNILLNASPAQISLLLQSQVSDKPRFVSDYIVSNLNAEQLKAILQRMITLQSQNPEADPSFNQSLDAYLGSLAHLQPAIISQTPPAIWQQLSTDSLKQVTSQSLDAWNQSLLGGPYHDALTTLIDAAKDEPTLAAQIKDLDGASLGSVLSSNLARYQRVMTQILQSENVEQRKAFMQSAPKAYSNS